MAYITSSPPKRIKGQKDKSRVKSKSKFRAPVRIAPPVINRNNSDDGPGFLTGFVIGSII